MEDGMGSNAPLAVTSLLACMNFMPRASGRRQGAEAWFADNRRFLSADVP